MPVGSIGGGSFGNNWLQSVLTEPRWKRADPSCESKKLFQSVPAAHSSRSNIIGSTDSARRAGIQVARSPNSDIATTTPAHTTGTSHYRVATASEAPSFQRDCRTYSESIGSGASSVFGPNSLWRSRKRTHAFQRRIASSFPAGLKCSAAPKSCNALTVQS